MTPLAYVGLAYITILMAIFAFVLRLTSATKDLDRRIEELERNKRGQ